jgi:UPF0755 protein
MSALDVAHELQDATPEEITFAILPGWRVEEIANSLATSGLQITYDQFLEAAKVPPQEFDFLAGASSVEGFLYPDAYIFPRTTSSAGEMIDRIVRNFAAHLTLDLTNGFDRQGLTVYQAVTLASLVEREAVQEEEQALIASVYLNRLNIGMKLDADPTVQYAIGYNFLTEPRMVDLRPEIMGALYRYGLPPTGANPGRAARGRVSRRDNLLLLPRQMRRLGFP